MEITPSEIYWILKLDDFHALFWAGIIVPGIVLVAAAFFAPLAFDLDTKEMGRFLRSLAWRCGVIAGIAGLAAAFTPTTKQMAMIKVVPAIVNSDIAKEVSGDAKEIYKLGIEAIKSNLQGK